MNTFVPEQMLHFSIIYEQKVSVSASIGYNFSNPGLLVVKDRIFPSGIPLNLLNVL